MARKYHRLRKLFIGLGISIVILVCFRLALPTIVQRYVNKKLDEIPEYDGRVGDVDIHLWRGAYSIDDVNIVKTTGEVPVPFVSAKTVDLSLQWKELFHGAAVGEIIVEDGHLNFVKGETKEDSQTSVDDVWLQVVKDLFPFKINRFAVKGGEVRFNDFHANPKVDVFVTNVVAIATNLVNSRKFHTKLPADFQMAGDTFGGGRLEIHMKIDPLADKPTFDLNFGMSKVDLTSLNDVMEAYGKFNVKRGTLEVYSEVACAEGQFDGYVKPFFENLDILEIKDDAKNPAKLMWQALVAGAVKLFKNHPKDQVATKIPIQGTLDQPEVQVWTTVVNILKNAFIEAFTPKLDRSIDLFKRDEEGKSEENLSKKEQQKEAKKRQEKIEKQEKKEREKELKQKKEQEKKTTRQDGGK